MCDEGISPGTEEKQDSVAKQLRILMALADWPDSYCPFKPGWYIANVKNRWWRPAGCNTNRCIWCAPWLAWLTGGAIALARPTRQVTLTMVGERWEEIQARINRLFERLRDRRLKPYKVQFAYQVEPNPRISGNHAHLYTRGDDIPTYEYEKWAPRVGIGTRVEVKPYEVRGSCTYALKEVTNIQNRDWKDARIQLDAFLALNGGRLVHSSNDFWRDAEGRKCNLDEAMDAWKKLHKKAEYVFINKRDLEKILIMGDDD